MSDSTESTVRASLEEERDHLQEQVDALAEGDFDENFADSGQVAAEQGEVQALAASLQEQLDAVEAAWPSSTRAPTGCASVAGSRSPPPASRPCPPRGSASTTPEPRRRVTPCAGSCT